MVRAVARANPRTVVILQAGSAVLVDDWVDEVAGVVHAFYGGCHAGTGIADLLTGAVDFRGRLPFSVARRESDLPPFDAAATTVTYDRWHGWWLLERQATPPTYPFGFGLSYGGLELAGSSARLEGDDIVVDAVVRGTGDREGTDVVQVYAELPDEQSPLRLVGFARVTVPAAGAGRVTLRIPTARFERRDPDLRTWLRPTGAHVLTVSRFAGDPRGRSRVVDLG